MAAVVRPLPELKPEIEFFWTAGRGRELRFKRCGGCGALVHPPRPICPYCRSREIDTTAVEGAGVVAGFTVNHHPWLPGFEPPYVVAIVAIDEDPRVRLTTNIVGCDPEEVFVGMRVQVVFEQQDDVWFPLFEPTGDPEPGPLPESDPMPPVVRRRWRAPTSSRNGSAISGIGMSPPRSSPHGRSALAHRRRLPPGDR